MLKSLQYGRDSKVALEVSEEALVADLSPSQERGASFGLYTFASGLGAVIGPLIGGWLYDQASHTAPFLFTAALTFLGALLIAVFVREPQRPAVTGP